MSEVALKFKVSKSTVHQWVKRAEGKRLDRVDWSDRPGGCSVAYNRTPQKIEKLALDVRKRLKDKSDLGEFGAEAIHRELINMKIGPPPSVRTIGRILERKGALDGRRRVRRPAPPRGWHIPEVASAKAELDSFDTVDGLVIKDGPQVEVLNGVSLHGGLAMSRPCKTACTTDMVIDALCGHWREFGLPGYAQFDNHPIFHGPHHYANTAGRVSRMCISLGVTPVFAPPYETGFQAAIENYNGRWQEKVWTRFHFNSLDELREQSDRYVKAYRRRIKQRIDSAPERKAFPKGWKPDYKTVLSGRMIYIRRTTESGSVSILGQAFEVDPHWQHRLVRAVVDFDHGCISFYALRRKNPENQPLLLRVDYRLNYE